MPNLGHVVYCVIDEQGRRYSRIYDKIGPAKGIVTRMRRYGNYQVLEGYVGWHTLDGLEYVTQEE